MSKYAIFKHGGKQYRVSEGEYLKLDHFSAEAKRRRKDSKLKRGFRRQFTRVKVVSIAG